MILLILPLVAALSGCLILTSAIDLAEGRAVLASESAHLTHVAGLVVLWMLAHAYRRPLPGRTLAAS
jgi:hypothetical protein